MSALKDSHVRPDAFFPIRCAIYIRVSAASGPRVQRRSLAAQRASCTSFLEAQGTLDWQVVGEHYEDRGYRGANLKRAAFRRLMADVEAGRVDVVVATRLDRLCTSFFDAVQVLMRFHRSGATFLAAEPIPIRSVKSSLRIISPDSAAVPGELP